MSQQTYIQLTFYYIWGEILFNEIMFWNRIPFGVKILKLSDWGDIIRIMKVLHKQCTAVGKYTYYSNFLPSFIFTLF